ncbi:MAG: GW dipeptide domain-containing protein [Bacteroidota bacterium]|nr:GW dipeptide domain-containing protein [Bacteroidota bacterium]
MRSLFAILSILVVFSGCVRKNKVPTAQNQSLANPSMHEVKVEEVIQASQYTYLKVSENGAENWIAVNRQEAEKGEIYYYNKALEMNNFHSKELERDFETIFFVQEISTLPIIADVQTPAQQGNKVGLSQKEGISVAPAVEGLSIAKLYSNRNDYAGKIIKMKGQVVKVNEEVMGKNWIHIQDGTKDGENFDLTITTLDKAAVDEVVTFEGTITLNKDFGYGYSYEVIMEDAKLVK